MTTCSKINTPSEKEIKKIYEKSVKLLGDSQLKLSEMQQVLKKAVIRLAFVSDNNDDEVNNILTEIKSSVGKNIKLQLLDTQLDNLFVLMNRPKYKQDVAKEQGSCHSLKSDFDKFEHSTLTDSLRSKITGLIDKKLPDEKMSLEILKIINEISISNHELNERNQVANNITDRTDSKNNRKSNKTLQAVQDIAIKLKQSISPDKSNITTEVDENKISDDHYKLKINALFIDIIDQMSLADEDRQQQISLQKALKNPVDCDQSWFYVIEQAIFLINQSISSTQLQNHDLQAFIVKINAQLSELKAYLLLTHQNSKDTVNRSSDLQESVGTSVYSIQQKISSADNINDLKNDISIHLTNIRKQVEENKLAEEKKEEISVQGFAHIVNELNITQEESNKLKQQLQENKKQLLRDSLTGLSNRLAYEERVAIEFNRWQRNKVPLSLAIWDIDYFKNVNDTYGHDVGDRVLKFFSELIQSRIRNLDLFARIGGEEFVLLMPDTSLNNAMKLNNTLRELLENCKFHYDSRACPITASVGLAEFQQGDEAEIVLKRADQALYLSKNAGRNCCTSL